MPALSARLDLVSGLAVDAAGNLYLGLRNYGDNIVVRLDPTGVLDRVAGGGPAITAFNAGDGLPATSVTLGAVDALAFDSSGNLYISEERPSVSGPGGYVREVSSAVIKTVTSSLHAFGIALDSAGSVYVADYWSVLKASNGVVTDIVGCRDGKCDVPGVDGPAPGGYLVGAEFVTVDAHGTVYFAMNDCGSTPCTGTVRKLSNGMISAVAGGGSVTGENIPAVGSLLGRIDGLALDSAGNLYIAQDDMAGFGTVRKISGGTIATVAGGGQSLEDNVPATSVWLKAPSAIAIDSTGNLYIADYGTGLLRKVSNGTMTTIAGNRAWPVADENGPATGAHLNLPAGVALDASGNLYIADSGNNVIRRVSQGVIATVAGGGASLDENVAATGAQLANPSAVAVAGNGDFYFAEADANVVRKVSGGIVTTVAGKRSSFGFSGDNGPATSATLWTPTGLALDAAGALFIADSKDNRVRKVSGGVITTVAGNGQQGGYGPYGVPATSVVLSSPKSVAVDAAGNLYATDSYWFLNEISNGILTRAAGGGNAVAVDALGNFYTAGFDGWVNSSAGTIAGNGLNAFGGDGGPALSAKLSYPAGLAVAPSGNIYVADTGNDRIRVLTPVACLATVEDPLIAIPAAGGIFGYNIAIDPSCPWTVSGLPNWVVLSGAGQGSGPAAITLVASANPGPPRLAGVSIAGQAVTLLQYGSGSPACVFTPEQASLHVPAPGGYYPVAVDGPPWTGGPAVCALFASVTADWIAFHGANAKYIETAFTGTQVFIIDIAPNTGAARSATIDFGGAQFTLEQDPFIPCLTFSPGTASFPAEGGPGVVSLSACPGTWWLATSIPDWIVGLSTSYTNGGLVTYQVLANNGAARSGTITFASFASGEQDSFSVQQAGASGGLRFVPVAPCRVADTRNPEGPFGGPAMAAGLTRSFAIPQSGCGIPATAQAYSLNVTVVPQGRLSFLSLWPAGQSQPVVSTLNSWDGIVVANAAIVPAGADGNVSVFASDPTDLILDIDGYFDSAGNSGASGYSFYPQTPCRVVDTRYPLGGFGPSMSGGESRDLAIPYGSCSVPPGAGAYSLNVTVVPDGYLGFLSTWPAGQPQPNVSTLNSWTGKVVANAAIVPAGANGSISAYASDPTDLILDFNGYFGLPGQSGGVSFYPLPPCRIADTRNGDGPFGGPILEASSVRSFTIPDSGCGVPNTATAYSVNVTVVPEGRLSFLTVWPAGAPQPVVSTLNSWDGSVVANAAIVPAGQNGGISVFVTDRTHLVLDINGYFAP